MFIFVNNMKLFCLKQRVIFYARDVNAVDFGFSETQGTRDFFWGISSTFFESEHNNKEITIYQRNKYF